MVKQKDTSIVGWGKNRHNTDFYVTPEETTRALMHREKFEGNIWECASGNGKMARVLEEFNNPVYVSDIRNDKNVYGQKNYDFVQDYPIQEHIDNIITNPPYRLAQEFLEQALHIAQRKVAMLLKLTFLESIKRYKFFKENPPKVVYVFCKRQKVYHADKEPTGSGLIAYAWFVWDRDYNGKTTIEWIL